MPIRRSVKRLLFIALLVVANARAAEVLDVGADGKTAAITQSRDTASFRMGEYLCVIDDEIDIACGPVIKVLAKGAIIRFDFVREAVSSGDKVVFGAPRVIASKEDAEAAQSEVLFRRRRIFAFDLSAGALVGASYLFPFFHFQGMVTPRISVGIQPLFMSSNATTPSLGAYGGFLTVNYYTSRYYRGFWFSAGVGGYFFSSPTSTRRAGVGAAIAHVGYRVSLYRGLNVGLAVGGQYMERPRTTPTLGFAETQVTGMLDIGFAF